MKSRILWLDPRTKLLVLLFCILAAMQSPSLFYTCGLIFLIACLGVLSGRARFAVLSFAVYIPFCLLTGVVLQMNPGTIQTMLIAFLGLAHKVYPCGVLSGVLLPTTKVSEFLAAMNRIHAPKSLVVPLAVMLRYMPTIREDWHSIKDAMQMRDVSPTLKGFLKNPVMTAECVYVPLLMSASKAADDLSIASVTRGIENPAPRTCLVQIGFRAPDVLIMLFFLAYLVSGFILK